MLDNFKLVAAGIIVAVGIALFYYLSEQSLLIRVGIVIVSVAAGVVVAAFSTPGRQALEFAKTARTEVKKVVWPTRKETLQATGIVMLLVIIVGIYLWLVDLALFEIIYDLILGLEA